MSRLSASGTALLVLCSTAVSHAAVLKPGTLAAWERYVSSADARIKTISGGDHSFLWLDTWPNQKNEVQHGKVTATQFKPRHPFVVPDGWIHDWIGDIFIPHTTLQKVLAVIRDYSKYPEWYGPTIDQAHLISSHDDDDRFTVLYLYHVLFVTASIETEYDTQFVQVTPDCWYSITRSNHIREVDKDETPAKQRGLADDGNGYVWRLYSICRYQQSGGGVYIEQESIALSRALPASIRWLVAPVARRLAADLLTGSLEQTRKAVLGEAVKSSH